jgi:beta-fructofuranosidase
MQRLDLGSSFYAPATMRDDRGRRLMWGWLREARRKAAVLASGWSGVQSLPRVLTLAEDNTLRMAPAPELAALRGAHWHREDLEVDADASPLLLPEIQGDTLEIRVTFDLAASTAQTFGLQVRRSPAAEEYTSILFDRAANRLSVDREHASLAATSYRNEQGGAVALADDEDLILHMFLDRSVLEIYANERACLAERIYPTRSDSVGIGLMACDGEVRVRSLDVWEMAADDPVVGDGRDH